MRVFIAVPIPEEVKNILTYLQDELKTADADLKGVEPQNIHLTLKFLGETEEEKIPLIKKIMDKITKDLTRFTASISCLGAFPKKEVPKVIWAGIEKGDNELKKLSKVLEEELAKIGIPQEKRPFSSHITLARVRSLKNLKNLVNKLEVLKDYPSKQKNEFLIEKVILYKSTLTPQGPIYEELYVSNLKTI